MKCAWQSFINLLPIWMREQVDRHGKETLHELRLRLNSPPELVRSNGIIHLMRNVTQMDIQNCINAASAYSPWSASTAAYGYITTPGGHRMGICGDAVITDGHIKGVRTVTSLCIRIAREYPGIADKLKGIQGSVLIIGSPGSGKTTLLRDLIRIQSEAGQAISVIDERRELFPLSSDGITFSRGVRTDVFSGCPKTAGVETVLRSMSPDVIAVDEITAKEDCDALMHAGWCGVQLYATAHAGNRDELYTRPIYKPIIDSHLFDILLILQRNKRWSMERMN